MLVAAALTFAGCGAGETGAPVEAKATATPRTTATPTPTTTPEPPNPARSVRECLTLWNADEAIGSTHQVSHTDFVAELARKGRTPVRVSYERRNCYVTVPVGPRRIAWFAAWRGRAPYTVPTRRNLNPREYVPYNGHALRDGRIAIR